MGGKGTHRPCVICGIRERHKNKPSLFFSSFPLDESRCREWVRVIGDEDLVSIPIKKLRELRHVCGDHFERKDLNKKGNRAKKHAIPKLNLRASPLSEDQMVGFPFPMATQSLRTESNPPLQLIKEQPSCSRYDHQVYENQNKGTEKRKLEGNSEVIPRKKTLMDASNITIIFLPDTLPNIATKEHYLIIDHDYALAVPKGSENKENKERKI